VRHEAIPDPARRLAIVIPALNEAASIGAVVRSLAGLGSIIVVDDGSSDGTGRIAHENGADVITHAANRGYDGALDSGFARAAATGADYVVTLDADGQHPTEMIAAFLAELEKGADLVVGVRDRLQRFAERMFALAGRLCFGIADPLCGMKGYRIGVYRALGHFDSYGSIGTELALFAVRRGATVAQLPVMTRDRQGSPRFGRLLGANLRILRAIAIGLRRYGATGRRAAAPPDQRNLTDRIS